MVWCAQCCISDTWRVVSWNDLVHWQMRHCLIFEVPDLWLGDSVYSYSSPSQMLVCKEPPPLPMTLFSLLFLLPRVAGAAFLWVFVRVRHSWLSGNWDSLGLRLIDILWNPCEEDPWLNLSTHLGVMQQYKNPVMQSRTGVCVGVEYFWHRALRFQDRKERLIVFRVPWWPLAVI